MKILDLPLKGKWYDMYKAGIKKEEYREITPYWIKRLCVRATCKAKSCDGPECACFVPKHDAVRLRYGYTKRTMLFELKDIKKGVGNPDWGAPDNEVFILKLGDRINETKN